LPDLTHALVDGFNRPSVQAARRSKLASSYLCISFVAGD
jgi:hypothetical protein